jgi:hypothetical protein
MMSWRTLLFFLAALVNLLTEVFLPGSGYEMASKLVLMPLLWWAHAQEPHWARKLLWPLSLAWLGDICMLYDGVDHFGLWALAAGATFFGLMQLIYFSYLWPFRKHLVGRPNFWPLVLFWVLAQAVFLGLAQLYLEDNAPMIGFILFYSGSHLAMVFFAIWLLLGSAIRPGILIGSILFVITDLIIGFATFVIPMNHEQDFWVMLSYILAQWLIVNGLWRHWQQAAQPSLSAKT